MAGKESDATKLSKNHLAFCLLGFTLMVETAIKLSAAQDILSRTFIPTTVFLMVNYGPHFVIAMVFPCFQQSVPVVFRWPLFCFCFTGGLVTIALAEDVHVRLAALAVTSVGHSTAEVTFAGLSAFYEETTIYWFSMGTGIGFVTGPLFYSGMTTLACFSPRTTILVAAALPLLYILSYFLLAKERLPRMYLSATCRKDVRYSAVDSEIHNTRLSCKEKLYVVWKSLPLFLNVFESFFLGYLTMQAIVTTIAFPSTSLDPRNHYVYYMVCFTTGEFVGRSCANIGRLIRPERDFLMRRYWLFTTVLLLNSMSLLLFSWYRLLPNVWLVFPFIFLNGLTMGGVYTNAFASAGEDLDPARKEFSRAFVVVNLACGIICAGLIGVYLEPRLRLHCIDTASDPNYCFTRPIHGWNATESCLL